MSWFKSFRKKPNTPSMGYMWGAETPPASKSFSNFTPRAQQVLALARKEADRLNHNFLGTEHLLLGLIKLGRGCAMNVLQKMGLNLEIVRSEVEKEAGTGPGRKIVGNIPYTPRTKKVVELAQKEAKALNHTYVGTEHILLGLLREGGGIAACVLRNLGLNIEKTRQAILQELDSRPVPPGSPPSTASPGQAKSTSSPSATPPEPQGEPVDTSKRYDVYCTDRSQGVTVYRNARFKGIKHLFQRSPYDTLSGYVELEQENGQTVFVARSSIIRFTEPGETGKQD